MPLFYDRLGREYRTTPPARLIEALRKEPHSTVWISKKGESIPHELQFHTNLGHASIHYHAGEYTHITCTAAIAALIGDPNAIS